METITDEQVRRYFDDKREKLEKKLAVQEQEISETKLQLENIKAALLAIGVDVIVVCEDNSVEDDKSDTSNQAEIKYDPSWRAWHKFTFALKHLGKSTAQEAADFIAKHDNSVSADRLRMRFKDLASFDSLKDQLEIDRSEKLFKYSLKE